jgi:hypothetical protein
LHAGERVCVCVCVCYERRGDLHDNNNVSACQYVDIGLGRR